MDMKGGRTQREEGHAGANLLNSLTAKGTHKHPLLDKLLW
jgi:hypothetical protein